MTPENAKQFVIVGVGASSLIAVMGSLGKTGEFPGARVAVGAFASAIILAGIAEFQPGIAGGIAAVMLATSTFVYGADAWSALSKATK